MNTYVYEFGDSLYLNITNRCPNNCEFCLRNFKDGVNDNELWLKAEPTFDDMVEDLSLYDLGKYRAVVFCGFGEPMCNLS
ncbi:MAG: radical SAM protein, partial [Clostridia bacterium]